MKHIIWLVAALSMTACYGTSSLGEGDTVVASAEVKQELMSRWNLVVENHPANFYDFRWSPFDEFPHPTYQGQGSEQGYQEFARILLEFLDVNFDYLAERRLFDLDLWYVFESGDRGHPWTFRELVNDFSADGFGTAEPARSGLQQMAARIEEAD